MISHIPPFVYGQPVSIEMQLNEMRRQIDRLSRITALAPLSVDDDGTGIKLRIDVPEYFYAHHHRAGR